MKSFRWALLAAPLVAAGCGQFGKAMTAHTDVVARAAGKELQVEEAAELLASNPAIEPEPRLVGFLADLWVDYTLLATAAAEDTTLGVLPLDQVIQPQIDEAVISRYLESAVSPDTSFTEAELASAWAQEGPGLEVRARHILIRAPADATQAQRDSARQLAASLRDRARAGEDFAQLAQQFSADGSASRGGDLGFFGRGRMVAPFEEAAFSLEPGEVSDVVETPFGYHVIKVEERRQQELGEQREGFRRFLVRRTQQEAVTAHIDSLTEAYSIELQPAAVEITKELAGMTDIDLRGRAAERTVVEYRGGRVTAGELAEQIASVPPAMRGQIAEAPDEQIEEFLRRQVALREVLLSDARERGVRLAEAEVDSIRAQNRTMIREILRAAGLGTTEIPEGASRDEAIEAKINELMQGAVAGTIPLRPLGSLGQALRRTYGSQVFPGTFSKVVEEMKEIRASQPAVAPPAGQPVPPQQPTPQAPAEPAPDTAG